MRVRPLVAFAVAIAWFTGNVVVVLTATTLFAHASPKAPANGCDVDIVSHEAAGAIFGGILHAWSVVAGFGPIPVCLLATLATATALMRRGWVWTSTLCLVAQLAAIGCHAWGSVIQGRMTALLASLRAGTTEGSGWKTFTDMHTQAKEIMSCETIAVLVLAILLATVLGRTPAGLPTTVRGPTL